MVAIWISQEGAARRLSGGLAENATHEPASLFRTKF